MDEQLIENGFIQPMEYGQKKAMLPNPPIQMESQSLYYSGRGPSLGEHTDELLKELGCDSESLERMKKSGDVIG